MYKIFEIFYYILFTYFHSKYLVPHPVIADSNYIIEAWNSNRTAVLSNSRGNHASVIRHG